MVCKRLQALPLLFDIERSFRTNLPRLLLKFISDMFHVHSIFVLIKEGGKAHRAILSASACESKKVLHICHYCFDVYKKRILFILKPSGASVSHTLYHFQFPSTVLISY